MRCFAPYSLARLLTLQPLATGGATITGRSAAYDAGVAGVAWRIDATVTELAVHIHGLSGDLKFAACDGSSLYGRRGAIVPAPLDASPGGRSPVTSAKRRAGSATAEQQLPSLVDRQPAIRIGRW